MPLVKCMLDLFFIKMINKVIKTLSKFEIRDFYNLHKTFILYFDSVLTYTQKNFYTKLQPTTTLFQYSYF